MEAVGLTEFQLSAGVVSKSLFNSICVKETAQRGATRNSFLRGHHQHLPTSLITVDTTLMLLLYRRYEQSL